MAKQKEPITPRFAPARFTTPPGGRAQPNPPQAPPAVYAPSAAATSPANRAGMAPPARLSPSSSFQVDSDPALGQAGQSVAQGVLQTGDRDLAILVRLFNINPAQVPFVIHITQTNPVDGGLLQGALHYGAGVEIWISPVNFDTGQFDTDMARMLAVAEIVECFSGWQNQGWVLDHTNGEGLSRVVAHALYPNLVPRARLGDAMAYFSGDQYDPAFVDCITDNSRGDQRNVSNGGAVLFLNWLTSGLGYAFDQVIQYGGPTLAETYTNLQGRNDAYQRFINDLQAAAPNGPTSDNPFISRI